MFICVLGNLIFYSFSIACRLLWHIEEGSDQDEGILLDDIANAVNDPTVSKNVVSKYMKWLYPSIRCTWKHGRIYHGIKWVDWSATVEQSSLDFQYPEYVTVVTATAHEIKLSVPTDAVVNGESVFLTVTVKREGGLQIICLDKAINLEKLLITNSIGWSQKDFDKLFTLISKLNVCQGVEFSGGRDTNTVTQWNTLGNENGRTIKRSKSCTILVQNRNARTCLLCSNGLARPQRPTVHQTDNSAAEASSSAMASTSSNDNERNAVKENDSADGNEAIGSSTVHEGDTITLTEEDDVDMKTIFMKCLQETPEEMKSFFSSQAENIKKCPTGRRWSTTVISVCLRLWCRSPRAYEDLRDSRFLVLPSSRLLRYYKNVIEQKPGINPSHLGWMLSEAKRQNVPDVGWRGGVSIDEMQIKDDVQISKTGSDWRLVGFIDLGSTGNIIEKLVSKKGAEMATHSLQYVFSGFTGFRWPVAFYATATATAYQLYITFMEVLEALIVHGFTVDYISVDGASTNRSFCKMLFIQSPRDHMYLFSNLFDKEQNIAVLQDIKHCLKKVRNSIESSRNTNKDDGR